MNNPINFVDPLGLFISNVPAPLAPTGPGGIGDPFYEHFLCELYGLFCPNPGPGPVAAGGGGGGGGGDGPTIPHASAKPKVTQKLVDDCAKEAFGRTSGIIPGTNKSVPRFDAAVMVLDASIMAGVDPAVVGATLALENNSDLAPPNHGNPDGTVDIGPMALNTASAGQPGGYTAYPGALGTNLQAGQPFNGDAYANILSGAGYLRQLGSRPERYVGRRASRKGALASLMPSMKNFFDCILKGLGLK